MYQNYFIINNKKYLSGTIFVIKNAMGEPVEATFVCYDTTRQKYVYNIGVCKHHVSQEYFQKMFIGVTNKINNSTHTPEVKTKPDYKINGLFIGWIWYIFLMSVSSIFYDRIGLWILISIVFFTWRSSKIKKEGTYVEW